MKKYLLSESSIAAIGLLLAAQTHLQGQAAFNPVALTPGSYTYGIVVPASSPQAVPACVNAFTGSGQCLTCDNTFYEQDLFTRPGQPGSNSGIPIHNTIFTNINNTNMTFLMPPDYTTNDDLMIVSNTVAGFGAILSGTLTFSNATTATKLAILGTDGNGAMTVKYTVKHANNTVAAGQINMLDWFTGGSTVAWGANGRMDQFGNYNDFSSSGSNNNPPYLYATIITASGASPIVSITFNYLSGAAVANFLAVSGSADGTHYTPIPVSGFNEMAIIPADIPFPVTATMDNGTNVDNPGNTWFEQGFYETNTAYGLPPSGSSFVSLSQPTHTYQMGDYSTNNAILIDVNHVSANMTPAAPAAYSGFAFLTAGANIGAGTMNSTCIVQHQDGVNETNTIYAYDWFNTSTPGALAWNANGRVDLDNRTLNNLGNGTPNLFESYAALSDAASPVTNIVVQYQSAPAGNSTTYIMAVSAASGAIRPVIISGVLPATQTWYPSQTATFSVLDSGTPPMTNTWLVESNGLYVPLTDGIDANGSTVFGSGTTTLTISNLTMADGTNYDYIVSNRVGSVGAVPALLIINSATPVGPIIDSQIPDASISTMSVFTNIPNKTNSFSVLVDATSAPPLSYQWYSGVPQSPANAIPNATNATYSSVDTAHVTLSCIVSNFVGTATSSPIALTAAAPASYQSAILAYHPLAYWPLNEPEGTVAFDYAGNNNGTYVGGCTLGQTGLPATAGVGTSTCVSFDGTSGYVDIPEANLNIAGPITLIEWIQTSGEGGNLTCSLGHGDDSYRFEMDPGGFPHFADAGPDVMGAIEVTDGVWHQLVGVYDGTNQHLYVDGLQAAPASASTTTPSENGFDVFIAGAPDYSPATRLFTGNIAQVAILTNALTASEVAALYTAPPYIAVGGDTSILSGEAYVGAPITYTVSAGGSLPLYYQWLTNGVAVNGATNSSFVLPAGCGDTTVQVAVTNSLSAGTPALSSIVTLQGDTYPAAITFTNGGGWSLNGSVQSLSGDVLELTDGNGDEASSAFYTTAQYIGNFNASFIYTAGGNKAADGVAFILQNSLSGVNALGAAGGGLGYNGITESLALELNIYSPNTIGMALGTNGTIGPYGATGEVLFSLGHPIQLQLNFADGILAVKLKDTLSRASFSTNYTLHVPLTNILGGADLAYIGFSGGDGGANSIQSISNFEFNAVIPPMLLAISRVTDSSFVLSWSAADPNWALQQSADLLAWTAGPTPVVAGGTNQATVTAPSGPMFYRLERIACQ